MKRSSPKMTKHGPDHVAKVVAYLRDAAESIPVAELPAFLGGLAEVTAKAHVRLLEGAREMTGEVKIRELVDAGEIARRLSLPESWVLEQARKRRIPSFRPGRYVRFDAEQVIDSLTQIAATRG